MKLDPVREETIWDASRRAVEAVSHGADIVEFEFNGVLLRVIAGMTAGDVVAEYMRRFSWDGLNK